MWASTPKTFTPEHERHALQQARREGLLPGLSDAGQDQRRVEIALPYAQGRLGAAPSSLSVAPCCLMNLVHLLHKKPVVIDFVHHFWGLFDYVCENLRIDESGRHSLIKCVVVPIDLRQC